MAQVFQSLIADMIERFNLLFKRICYNGRAQFELTKANMVSNPTLGIRTMLNNPNIAAIASPQYVQIFPCRQLEDYQLETLPMPTDICATDIPVRYYPTAGKRLPHYGYLNPTDNIIRRMISRTVDCREVETIPLMLRNRLFLYHAVTGQLEELNNSSLNHLRQQLAGLQQPMPPTDPIIFAAISMYTDAEGNGLIQTLNDVFRSHLHTSLTLSELGADLQEDNHEANAMAISSNTINKALVGAFKGYINPINTTLWLTIIMVGLIVLSLCCCPFNNLKKAIDNNPLAWIKRIKCGVRKAPDGRRTNRAPTATPTASQGSSNFHTDPDSAYGAFISQRPLPAGSIRSSRTPPASASMHNLSHESEPLVSAPISPQPTVHGSSVPSENSLAPKLYRFNVSPAPKGTYTPPLPTKVATAYRKDYFPMNMLYGPGVQNGTLPSARSEGSAVSETHTDNSTQSYPPTSPRKSALKLNTELSTKLTPKPVSSRYVSTTGPSLPELDPECDPNDQRAVAFSGNNRE
jgi:hypothetical protein